MPRTRVALPLPAAALVVALAACSPPASSEDPITGRTAAPTASPTGGTTGTPVVPPARPSGFATAAPRGALTFRTYLGAVVPGGEAGPRTTAGGTASGWRRDPAGAVLAAAHAAVALDPRQPRALWRPVVDGAVPRDRVARVRGRVETQAAAWDARLDADERERRDRPGDTDVGQGPASIWRPPVRVVAYSDLAVSGRDARVVVWARTDGTSRWGSREVGLRWARGDWRLRLPVPGAWASGPPPRDIRPISELSS